MIFPFQNTSRYRLAWAKVFVRSQSDPTAWGELTELPYLLARFNGAASRHEGDGGEGMGGEGRTRRRIEGKEREKWRAEEACSRYRRAVAAQTARSRCK